MAKWKSTLVASWLAQICSIMGFAIVIPFLPFYVRELGVTDEKAVLLWSGWGLSTSVGLTMALVSPLWGMLADRHGRKMMVMRSMFGGMLVLGLMGLVQNVYQLLALRILQGVLTGTVTASVALISSIVPTRRAGFALGLMQTALFIGNSIGPLAGGPIAQQYGYRLPFVFAAGLLLAGGMLTWLAVHEDFDPNEMQASGDGRSTLWQVLTLAGLPTMLLLLFLVQFSGAFVTPILPLYIERISGLLPGKATGLTGYVFGLGGVSAALAATVLGRMGDKLGYGRVLVVCTLLTGVMMIPHGLAHTWQQLLFWRLCVMFVGAGTIPATNALIRIMIPRHACGKAFGIAQSVSCLGWGLGPAVGSSLAAEYGMRQPFFIVGGMFIVLSVVVAIAMKKIMPAVKLAQAEEAAATARAAAGSD
ncbi:MAG: MFS transporter [Armatimonadota bacterium]